MKRHLFRILAATMLISLVAAACGASQDALVVGNTTISRSDLLDELGARGELIDGIAPTGAAAAFLTEEIQRELVRSAVEVQGIDVEVGPTTDLQNVFELIVANEVEQRVPDIRAVAESVTTCSRHILVATEDEANELLASLAGGADFAALAQEFSNDPGSGSLGGDLGCVQAGQFVPEFETALAAAETGEPVGPVESQFGFHIIEKLANSADAASIVEAGFGVAFEGQEGYDAWFDETFVSPNIEVDPRYGSWDTEQFSVVAPNG